MARKTKVLGFSVPPAIADEYERLATRQRKSKSELFRERVEAYKAKLEEDAFLRLQARMSRKARRVGVLTERQVEQIVFEDR